MDTKYVLEKITDQYLKNIANLTNDFANTLHLIYREHDFSKDLNVKWFFWDLEEKCARYWTYKDDKEGVFFHEEDIFLEAKKAKENYDTYK